MMKLLKIEYLKVKNYSTFWVILIIYAALVPLSFLGLSQIEFPFFPSKSEMFGFPTVWNYITWTASWFNVLLGVLVVILVCNDIAFKTQRQHVIEGLSRRQVILGKIYFLMALAIAIGLFTFILGSILGMIYSSPSQMFNGIEFLVIYIVQTFGYFAFAFFWAVLIRKPALSIILFVVIVLLDDIVKWPLGSEIGQFFPTITISELTPFPFFRELMDFSVQQDPNFKEPFVLSQTLRSILSLVYTAGFVFIGYISLKRRDL